MFQIKLIFNYQVSIVFKMNALRWSGTFLLNIFYNNLELNFKLLKDANF